MVIQISRQSNKAHTSYRDLKSVAKRRRKIRRKQDELWRHISREQLGGFSSNLELGVPHPEEICTEYFVCFCSGSFELQMRENGVFFTPVKYTLVCRTPKLSWFLGPHDTLPCVLITALWCSIVCCNKESTEWVLELLEMVYTKEELPLQYVNQICSHSKSTWKESSVCNLWF